MDSAASALDRILRALIHGNAGHTDEMHIKELTDDRLVTQFKETDVEWVWFRLGNIDEIPPRDQLDMSDLPPMVGEL
jgi:hypothetical protein